MCLWIYYAIMIFSLLNIVFGTISVCAKNNGRTIDLPQTLWAIKFNFDSIDTLPVPFESKCLFFQTDHPLSLQPREKDYDYQDRHYGCVIQFVSIVLENTFYDLCVDISHGVPTYPAYIHD